jgi:hypothetical protein
VEEITRLLAGLGETAEQVAETLRAHRILGIRLATTFDNPIVRYLNRNLDIGGWLEVRDSTLTLLRRSSSYQIALPAPVVEFLAAFDRGAYPHLEKA